MLLNSLIRNDLFGSTKQNRFAIKMSVYVTILLTGALYALIIINHYRTIYNESQDFKEDLKHIVNNEIVPMEAINYTSNEMEVVKHIGKFMDFQVLKGDKVTEASGIFKNISKEDFDKLKQEDGISSIEVGEGDYLISRITRGSQIIYIAKDISSYHKSEDGIIRVAIILDILLFIFIYLLSRRLAILAFEPLELVNRQLHTYNHQLAHELKTPLAIIQSDLELAKLNGKNCKNGGCAMEMIESGIDEVKNMEKIINSLLYLSEVGGDIGQENINVHNTIKKMTKKIESLYSSKEVDIELRGPSNVMIQAHSKLFEIICKNIIENAFKYALDKSTITIEVKKRGFIVSNTGKTLSKNDLGRIFQPFFRANSKIEGTGLGLSIVKTIADIYGWKVYFQSEKGRNVFSLEF